MRWANDSVFEYIRIVRTEYIRKPNYSVIFKNRITFVFVFGRYFQTEYIRIRIRSSFFNRIYSYSYSVYDNIQIIFAFQLTWKYNLTALKPVYKEDKNQSVAVLGIPTSTTPNTTPRTSTTPSTTHRITKSTTPSTTPTTNPNNAPNTTPSTTSITTTKHPRLHDAVFICTWVGGGGGSGSSE